jgi:hypothetical protein
MQPRQGGQDGGITRRHEADGEEERQEDGEAGEEHERRAHDGATFPCGARLI